MKENTKKRGPKENRLALDGDWKEAVVTALKKKRPPGGWPRPEKKVKKP